MKHDHSSFSGAPASPGITPRRVTGAYAGDVADRVRRFLPMVRRLAWHVQGSGRPGIEIEDLIQAGLVALTECAQRHDGPGEDGFAAYAKMRVRGAMVDLVRRALPLSRGASDRRKQLRAAEDTLRTRLGRDPDSAEMAAELGIAQEDLAARRASSQPLHFESIDEVYSDSDIAFAETGPNPLELVADEEMRGALRDAVADLPERLQLVVQLYFVEELNLSEIAEVLGVSVPRVHQLKAQALGHLRKAMEGMAEIL